MTEQTGGLPARPSVSGVLPARVHDLHSPHVEMLARLAVAGGTLTTREGREVCAAVLAHLEARDSASR